MKHINKVSVVKAQTTCTEITDLLNDQSLDCIKGVLDALKASS